MMVDLEIGGKGGQEIGELPAERDRPFGRAPMNHLEVKAPSESLDRIEVFRSGAVLGQELFSSQIRALGKRFCRLFADPAFKLLRLSPGTDTHGDGGDL